MSKKSQSRDSDFYLDNIRDTLSLLENKSLLSSPNGKYIKYNGSDVAPKIQDILYKKFLDGEFDYEKTIKQAVRQVAKSSLGLKDVTRTKDYESGLVFIIPYGSLLALSSDDYLAQRIISKNNEVLFINQISIINDFSNSIDKEGHYMGTSVFFSGLLSNTNIDLDDQKIVSEQYDKVLNYIDDYITAYRLLHHDHNIYRVTKRLLPSFIKCYKIQLKPNINLVETKMSFVHPHDFMDQTSKIVLPDQIIAKFQEYCEILPYHKEIRYTLDTMLDSINALCLGNYEDALILSDRFTELALRQLFNKTPGLETIKLYDNLYSTNNPDKAIVNAMADRLGLKGDSIIGTWWEKSRKLRNNLIHKMDFDSVTQETSAKAMKYNFEIVRKFIDSIEIDKDDPIILLKLGQETYYNLFEMTDGKLLMETFSSRIKP